MAREPLRLLQPGAPGILPQGVTMPSGGEAPWQSPTISYLQGLGISGLSGITELVGWTLPGAEEFRRENPVAGFVSQVGSASVPYLGWFAAAKKVKNVASVISKIGNLEKSPIVAGAAREAVTLLPFEVGRVGASQLLPMAQSSLSDMTNSAIFDLTLSAGVGGLVHGFAAAGRRAPREPIPELDLAAPPSLQIRKLKELLAGKTLTPAQSGAAVNKLKDLDAKARAETAPAKRYVSEVNRNPALTRTLSSLFEVTRQSGVTKKKMFWISDKSGFADEKSWKDAAKWNGLDPENFAETGRYFREITFQPTGKTEANARDIAKQLEEMQGGRISPEAFQKYVDKKMEKDYAAKRAAGVDKQLREGMQSLGFSWLIAKEESGLYILARKTRGRFGQGKVDDRWVLFKTDQPGRYLPKHLKFSQQVLDSNSWHKGAQALPEGVDTYDKVRKFYNEFPTEVAEEIAKPGRLDRLLPKDLVRTDKEFVRGVGDGLRNYLAPAVAQFRKSKLANKIHQVARFGYNLADTKTHQLVFGTTLPGKRNLFMESLTAPSLDPNRPSIKTILDGLDPVEKQQLMGLRNNLVDPATYQDVVARGEISPKTADAALKLEAIADVVEAENMQLAIGLGERYRSRVKGDLGLPQSWDGDARIALANASGDVVTVASGRSKKVAQALAARLVKENPELHIAEQMDVSKLPDRQQLASAPIGAEIKSTIGSSDNPRKLRGFKWDYEPVDGNELLVDFQKAYNRKFRWQMEQTEKDLLKQPMALLNEVDPSMFNTLDARMRDLRGEQGAFGKLVNKTLDKHLAPIIGENSASQIVAVTNTGMAVWHLGMGQIAHPIMTVFTFMNTVLPEMAMIIGATVKDLSHYSFFLAGGTKGPVGPMAFLSPAKILVNSFREMGNPSEALQRGINRAGMEAVVQPRVAEEFIGQNAARLKDLRAAIASPGGFAAWLKELAIWMPANSERLSRVHAFTVGWQMARDVVGLVDEERIYQFAKEFTEKTMFSYTTADRPRIFTTPLGSAAGLFKTWMMNYMTAMLEYTGQAAKGNFAPLAWQTAGTAAMGGVAATPLYWIADGFSKAFTGDSMLQNTYENLSEGPGDALMFGLPAALTGISLYSQSTSPLSNPARDASAMWSLVTLNRAQALTEAAGLAWDNWHATGQHPGASIAVRDAIVRAIAPSTISRMVSAFSGDDVIRSLHSGYPMVSNVPLWERALYGVKLNSADLDRAMAIADELYADRAKERAAVVSLGRAMAEASDQGDFKGVAAAARQAMEWGIDPSKVYRSAMNREKLQQEPLLERTFRPEKLAPFYPALRQ